MHFDLLAIYERGKPLDLKTQRGRPRIVADVQVHTDMESPLGRPTLSAAILNTSPGQDILPRLYDVRLTGMATLAFTIEGVEFIDGQMYHQVWHCKVRENMIQVPWTMCSRSTLDELL